MDKTANLNLPYIMPAQAQKHVTHNEAIRALDALVHLSVLDRDLSAPPGSPADGDRYLVAASASGDWSGRDGDFAAYQDNAWMFYSPLAGWTVWIEDESKLLAFNGTTWIEISGGGGSVNPTSLVGVNATADTTNRLSLSSPASLFNHEGNDHRQKINKAAVGDTASQLYQTGFSGRAEIGLTGDDDFHLKVSPDGTTFHDAIVADKDDGVVSFPSGHVIPTMIVVDEKANSTAGGTSVAGVWTKRDLNTVRHNSISGASLASNEVTLPAGTYRVCASAPAFQAWRHQIRLRSTGGVTLSVGTSEICDGAGTIYTQTHSSVSDVLQLATSTTFFIEHNVQTALATYGYGWPTGGASLPGFTLAEVYSAIHIERIG